MDWRRYAVLAKGIEVGAPDGVEAGDRVTVDIITGRLATDDRGGDSQGTA